MQLYLCLNTITSFILLTPAPWMARGVLKEKKSTNRREILWFYLLSLLSSAVKHLNHLHLSSSGASNPETRALQLLSGLESAAVFLSFFCSPSTDQSRAHVLSQQECLSGMPSWKPVQTIQLGCDMCRRLTWVSRRRVSDQREAEGAGIMQTHSHVHAKQLHSRHESHTTNTQMSSFRLAWLVSVFPPLQQQQ